MVLACLDLEGVLIPEIWINVAETTKIPELRLTTRDISDYNELMRHRLTILRQNKIKFVQIENVIKTLKPLPGADHFYKQLRERFQIIILSDTYYQFAMPLMKQLDFPTIFCHNLIIDKEGYIADYKLRMKEAKKNAVIKLRELNFKIIACGDSYNDVTMLKEAHIGIFYNPPEKISKEFPEFPIANNYEVLWEEFIKADEKLKMET